MIVAERDVPLRSMVLMWDERDYYGEERKSRHIGRELYVRDSEWDDFVSLINKLDLDRKAQKLATDIIKKRDEWKKIS